ncbi:MAG: helix-turn-helix domain-containing protein [Specibacter sp.]
MGRTQTFNTAEVVRAARTVFWEQGFEAASLPELEQATGLSRSSLYHAFGNKRGLFDAAVESYLVEIIRPRLLPLTTAPVAPGAVIDYFTSLRAGLARSESLPASRGCLLVNAAGAPIANDDAVSDTIAGYRKELQTALDSGLAAHRGDLDEARRRQLATILGSLVVAAMALARVDSKQAVATVDAALELLNH